MRRSRVGAEVESKSAEQIERETARRWADRAIACIRLGRGRNDKWLRRAIDYRHEALEHAALVGDEGALVGALQRELDRAGIR